jgi:dephospho-CoA kinase
MTIVGLTGGIASGKSTVANLFTELGAYLIDWDVLAREVVRPHLKAWEEIVEYFGEEVLNEDSTLNRQKLGEVVFNDEKKRGRLNQMVHPRIFEEDIRKTQEIRNLNPDAVVIKDIPLLIEIQARQFVDKTLVVYASEETQLKRLMERGLSLEEAEERIKAQLPLTEKVKFADFVVYNDGSLEEIKRQIEKIYASLRGEREGMEVSSKEINR